ncbi:ABC transporter permease [Aminithiophilus ramosus]|uniref:ABC transporter permease n=1 Tax=Aminithiophilus ramosus TaxID=3029084 RepID=A0A9Q7EXR1_9BACT|nr:ABC transporter permease [Aminithiophilus ramosus]QTX32740.1 ABC transporter permease [Aminithiophilus ramosus]
MTDEGLSVAVAAEKIHLYRKKSQIRTVWLRLKKNRMAMFGFVLFSAMMALVLSADLYMDYEEEAIAQNLSIRFQAPSKDHLLGTDQYGRDLLTRVIYGGRISLFVGLATICISLTAGSLIGATAAYYGGKTDDILMRIMDVFLAIPNTLMAITLVAALGTSLVNLILAMGLSQIPRMSRIVRSSVLSIIGQEYIEAARACGTGDGRIIFRHILPNAMGPILVQVTQTVARSVITIASLSFIGLGISEPTPEWGSMLSEAKSQLRYHPYLAVAPGVAIVMAVMSLTLLGDGLRDALDPRLKN